MSKISKLFLFVLFIAVVIPSVDSAEFNFFNISRCIGEAQVKVNLNDKTLDEYTLAGCKHISTKIWDCPCPNQRVNLILQTEQKNRYNFLVQYYIGEDESEEKNNKRLYNFYVDTNIQLMKKEAVWKFPEFKLNIILTALFLVFMTIGIATIIVLKKYVFTKENKIEGEEYDYQPKSFEKMITQKPEIRTGYDTDLIEKNDFAKSIDAKFQEARQKIKEQEKNDS